MSFTDKLKHLGPIITHTAELAEDHAGEAYKILMIVGGIVAALVPPAAPVVAVVEGAAGTVTTVLETAKNTTVVTGPKP